MQNNFIAVMGATGNTGKKITVQFSYDDQSKALVQAGLSEAFANLYVEMTRAFNEGTIKPNRTRENTTPTRFEDFADELARAYEAM